MYTDRRILVASTTNLQEIDPSIHDNAQLLDRVLQLGLDLVIHTVQLDTHREPLGRRLAHSLDDIRHDLGALDGIATVRIGPEVRLGAQELRQQVPMRRVNLDSIKARLGTDPRRGGKPAHHVLDLGNAHLFRRSKRQRGHHSREKTATQLQRHRRRRQALGEEAALARAEGRLPTGVVDLHHGRRAPGGVPARSRPGLPLGEHLGVIVEEDVVARLAEVALVDLHVARHDETPAALAPLLVGGVQGGRGHAVRAHGLGHGGLGEAVGQGEPAGEGDWLGDM